MITVIGTNNDFVTSVAVQNDGKILAAGYTSNGSNNDMVLMRYNIDGSLDTSFNGSGKVITTFGTGNDQAYGVAVQNDGKIVVAGFAVISSTTYIALARYNSDGSLDTNFGEGAGKVANSAGNGASLVLQTDGKILVGASGSGGTFILARHNTDGSLDTTFGGGTGKVTSSLNGVLLGMTLQSDGRIVAVGYSNTANEDVVLARYTTDGTLDTTFGSGTGKVSTPVGSGNDRGISVAMQADGKILVSGHAGTTTNEDTILLRYDADGGLDSTFGSGGKLTFSLGTSNDRGTSVLVQSDQKILVGGYANDGTNLNNHFSLMRFNGDGSFDTTFNGTGKVLTPSPAGSSSEFINAMSFDTNGMLVAVGGASTSLSGVFGFDLMVARYQTAPGTPVVTTGMASARTATTATLNGVVQPGGLDTIAYFEYGLTTSYGSVTSSQSIGQTGAISVQAAAGSLISGAVYHYRIVATNSAGTKYGSDVTFTPLQPQRYERMAAFSAPTGTAPMAGLVQGQDGSFYGTTSKGGAYAKGTVFRLGPDGKMTVLHSFSGMDGDSPQAGVVQASDGDFYGTTYFGGSDDRGVIFRITPSGTMITLEHFQFTNGSNPDGELFEASDGYLYGVTRFGGTTSSTTLNRGTVFRITKNGALTKLVNLGTGGIDMQAPIGAVFRQGTDGNLYSGMLTAVYRLSLNGAMSLFAGVSGDQNNHPLVIGDDGYFYGVSASGGTASAGMCFGISPGGAFQQLASFTTATTGKSPHVLVRSEDGSFYGVTQQGGTFNRGTFFRLGLDGSLSALHHFSSTSGTPNKGMIQALDGNFYGTTAAVGTSGGSIFRITPSGSLTTLVELNGFNGRHDRASLMQTTDGKFIGTGSGGGDQQQGTVFSVSPAGSLTSLASFDAPMLGSDPVAALVKAADGNYYGTARAGGANSKGTVFRMTPAGLVTVLTAFDGGNGAFPEAGLALGGDGNLYGTTKEGGSSNLGTVFRLTTAGVLTVLHHFSGADGSLPLHRLILAADGHLYGTTSAGGATGNGLVFRLTTASGTVTTVAELNGANGQAPNELRQLPDGSFVGTTRLGGSGNLGTVFAMAADGTITTLHHFNGTNGQWPESVLARAPDGSLYGTTSAGGTADGGTLFKIVAGSIFVPVMDFGSVPDEKPTGPVFFGQDGNLYGTTRNSVFRFLFPGAPIADAGSASSITTTSAVIDAKVNARGSSTQSTIEYGIDGVSFPLSATAAPLSVSGYTTTRVGATLAGLVSGTRYYYRLRSVSSAGTTVSPVASFATQSLAYAATTPAAGLGPTSATLNGIVNAFENSATVTFEYGTDGNAFPISIAATPATVTGDADTPVAAAIAGLTKGVTYYFRVRATTTAGTTISGATSFRTLIEPLATTGPALALSTTTARVTGTVQARDADTQVFFEYGTSPTTFPNIIAAIPGLVTGDNPVSVAADLPNLAAGVTYYFRVRASSAGGLAYSAASSFQLQVLSGFTQVFPPAPPSSEGFLVVNLTPAGILHGWRFVGEQQWRASGVPAGGLTTGDRDIEFRPVPGYNQPPTESVGIVSGEAATVITRDYYASSTSGSGGLSVTLKPDSITTGPDRAQWRLLGENDAQWRDSGAGISSLIAGSYLIECKPVTGRATPPNVNVIVSNGATAAPTITYFLPDATAGAPPSVLAFESVTGDTTKPYAHVGQIRSNAGSSSGFVVKARVVATAAHVVWDDGTLSAAQGLQWLFQRHRGTHEPKPVFPRGFYLFDGYAAQRVIDNSPGDSSPQSQTLDVAAMYFDQDAGRGGYGGFLASDLSSNEFLLSNANKMLVGYPVDGVATTSQGRMHATAPFNVVFNAAFGRTFTTSGIRSSGGNSGGPLCVQFEGGAYYPAAIYLGGDNQTVVRAIDSAVIDLFNRAEVSGNGGGNNTGGGITHTSVTGQLSPGNPGRFQILIEPAAARTAGAGWSLVPASLTPTSTYRQSGAQTSNLSAGDYKVVFVSVGGFQPPVEQSVTVTGGQVNTFTYTYAPLMTPQESWRQQHFSTTSNTGNAADTFDFDGDGFTNAQEYAAGTNPTLSGDFFKVTDSQRTASTFTASTTGKAGRTYTLQRSTNLTSWTPVGSPQGPLASDGAVTLQDTAMPNDAAFYRIVVTGP
ncbi:MAG: hypothetical protein IAE77_08840 [Prosthecobacter sp.]|nr:hypothetical protein [Prosthecobacter sp.]